MVSEKDASGRIRSNESLCGFCGNACRNGCSWAENLEPVEGWTAIQNKNGYFIVECPEFCDDGWMRKNPEGLDTEGCLKLLEAMIKVMRQDYAYLPRCRQAIERFIRNPKFSAFFFFAEPEEIIRLLRKGMRHTI